MTSLGKESAERPDSAPADHAESDPQFLFFAAKVAEAESCAAATPKLYALKVLLWAALGYMYMLVVPAALLVVVGLIVLLSLKLGFLLFALKPVVLAILAAAACYVKALFIRIPRPEGIELKRSSFPQLFKVVDELSAQTGVKVDHILLTAEMNASVTQHPRLGLFGFYANYLNLGLCLMLALNADEFRSVIAHELGHLAGQHSKKTAWLYAKRLRWAKIQTSLEQSASFVLLITRSFLDWYYPRFLTLTQVMARRQEREADQLAIEAVGADVFARSFMSVALRQSLIDSESMNEIYQSYPIETTPPADIYFRVAERLSAPLVDREQMIEQLEACLAASPSPFDTHPADAQRIAASPLVRALEGCPLREKAEKLIAIFDLASAPEKNAAQVLFAEDYEKAVNLLNSQWQNDTREGWKVRYAHLTALRRRLDSLEKLAAERALTVDESVERAEAVAGLGSEAEARPLYLAVQEQYPGEPRTAYYLACELLKERRAEALPLLEMAVATPSDCYVSACVRLIDYYQKQGADDRVLEYRSLLEKHLEISQERESELSAIDPQDTFVEHSAEPEQVDLLVDQLRQYKAIRSAYLVQKRLQSPGPTRMFVLFVRMRIDPGSYMADEKAKNIAPLLAELADRLSFPDRGYIYIINSRKDPYLTKIEQIAGARIYQA